MGRLSFTAWGVELTEEALDELTEGAVSAKSPAFSLPAVCSQDSESWAGSPQPPHSACPSDEHQAISELANGAHPEEDQDASQRPGSLTWPRKSLAGSDNNCNSHLSSCRSHT